MGGETERRLYWACRRGALELDLVLQGFLAEVYPRLNAAERIAFERLLECDDPTLLGLLNGASPDELDIGQDEALGAVIDQLLRHARRSG